MDSSNFTPFISTISLDLGARHTGVFLSHYESGTDLAHGHHQAITLVIPENGNGITWSQVSRTQARHRVRNYKRRKMAKRLLRVLIEEGLGHRLQAKEWNALSALLNRRGYNRVQAEIDIETFDRIEPDWHADTFPDYFDASLPLSTQAEILLNAPDKLSELLEDPTFTLNQKALKKQLKDAQVDPDQLDDYLDVHKKLVELFSRTLNDIRMGARHRRDYLANIQKELNKDSRLAALRSKLGETRLYCLIGNVSNLQLRTLRWYFNDPSMRAADRYDDPRLLDALRRWAEGWRPETDDEKETRRALLKSLNQATSALEWLQTSDPEISIPPYEDQDNRRPPKDQTLWLNPEALGRQYANWQIWANNLRKAQTNAGWFEDLAEAVKPVDRASRLGRKDPDLKPYEDTRFLQRLLDRNGKLDPYALRLNARGVSSHKAQEGLEKLSADLGRQHLKDFLRFCEKYYREVTHARQGTWVKSNNGLLEAANLNPPRKQSLLHLLVANVLGEPGWTPAKLDRFREQLWLARQGRSTLKGLAQKVEETRKKYGNLFNELLQKALYLSEKQNKKLHANASKEEKDAFKDAVLVWKKTQEAANRIAEHLGHDETQRARYANPFSIAQLYTLLETDRRGFSRTSLAAHLENNWRMQTVQVDGQQVARCSRLAADSVRPFDGVLRRILERQAIEIAKLKYQQLEEKFADNWPDHLRLPIVIEENRFAFTLELYDAKTLSKQAAKRKQVEKALQLQRTQWQDKLARIRAAS